MNNVFSNQIEKLKDTHEIKNIFLFVTATKIESEALKKVMKPLDKLQTIYKSSFGKNTYSIGLIGIYTIVHVMCGDMGTMGRDSSILTVTEAIEHWNPCGIVMVGIAFGKDEEKQKIGDVLISKSVINYECSRISVDKIEFRSKNVESGQILFNRFYNKDNWQHYINNILATPISGSILSGEKLIDNPSYKNSLFEQFSNAIGGEMEGYGVYSASANKNITEWIIVKGICDWADGNKNENKDGNQLIAAESAVSLCEAVFSENVFSVLYNEDSKISSKKKDYKMPMRNKLFSGRDAILDSITDKFISSNIVVLSGLSGIGKSQIAKEYVYRYQEKFESSTWITATDYTQLIQEYSLFIECFNLSIESNRPNNDNIIECFKSNFENQNNILVIDNANNINLSEIISYLPQKNTKIIITTQNSNWDAEIVGGIIIDNFLEKEASEYLLNNTSKRLKIESDKEDSDKLLQNLNFYPIAVEYARAYINKRKISFKKYLDIYDEYRTKLFNKELNDYHQSAIVAWKVSICSASEILKAAKEFLYYCSLLSFDSIPTDILFIENKIYTRVEIDDILDALLSYSLVEIISDCTIRIHPLIQDYIKMEQKEEGKYDEVVNQQIRLVMSSFPDIITTKEETQQTKILISHGFSIMNNLFQDKVYLETVIKIARDLTGKLYNFGDYINTINWINVIINKVEKDKFMLEYVWFLNVLALSYHYIGETKKANFNIDTAISNIEKTTDILKLYILYNTKGIILKGMGNYSESLKIYKLALKLAKKNNDKNIFNSILMNIGIIHKHNLEYAKAINAYKFCLKNCENNPLKLKLLSNIAIIYKEKGKSKLAIPIFEECLENAENIGDLRFCAITHDHLGYCYLAEGEKSKSYDNLVKSLNIVDEINYEYGKASILYNFGTYYLSWGDLKLAKNNYEKSLELCKKLNYTKGIFLANEGLQNLDRLQ